jgi:hypothetical protein
MKPGALSWMEFVKKQEELSLRTAQANEYSLDKEQTSYDNLMDGLNLSLKGYKLS